MNYDIKCPYCGHEQDICNDDGHGTVEDETYEEECHRCEKTFVFGASIIISYHAKKADCLNGSGHRFEPTKTFPKEFTKMRCCDCDLERHPTEEEWAEIKEKQNE